MLTCTLVSNSFNTQYNVCFFLFTNQASSTLLISVPRRLVGMLYREFLYVVLLHNLMEVCELTSTIANVAPLNQLWTAHSE